MSSQSTLVVLDRAQRIGRQSIVYSFDLAAFFLSTILAFELRFDGAVPAQYFHPMGVALCVWAAAKFASFIVARVSQVSWRHTSANDAVHIVLANSTGAILGGLIVFLLVGPGGIPRSVYILDWLICCLLTSGGRLTVRVVLTAKSRNKVEGERTRTLIYGAGAAGLALLWELLQNPSLMCDVVGFVDDDPGKARLVLDGERVLGSGEALEALVRKHAIKRLLIAIPSASGQEMVRILKLATDAKV